MFRYHRSRTEKKIVTAARDKCVNFEDYSHFILRFHCSFPVKRQLYKNPRRDFLELPLIAQPCIESMFKTPDTRAALNIHSLYPPSSSSVFQLWIRVCKPEEAANHFSSYIRSILRVFALANTSTSARLHWRCLQSAADSGWPHPQHPTVGEGDVLVCEPEIGFKLLIHALYYVESGGLAPSSGQSVQIDSPYPARNRMYQWSMTAIDIRYCPLNILRLSVSPDSISLYLHIISVGPFHGLPA